MNMMRSANVPKEAVMDIHVCLSADLDGSKLLLQIDEKVKRIDDGAVSRILERNNSIGDGRRSDCGEDVCQNEDINERSWTNTTSPTMYRALRFEDSVAARKGSQCSLLSVST